MKNTDLRRLVSEAVSEAVQKSLPEVLGGALAVALRERVVNVQNRLTLAVAEEMGDTSAIEKPKFSDLERTGRAAVEAALRDEELRKMLLDVAVHAMMTTFSGRR